MLCLMFNVVRDCCVRDDVAGGGGGGRGGGGGGRRTHGGSRGGGGRGGETEDMEGCRTEKLDDGWPESEEKYSKICNCEDRIA